MVELVGAGRLWVGDAVGSVDLEVLLVEHVADRARVATDADLGGGGGGEDLTWSQRWVGQQAAREMRHRCRRCRVLGGVRRRLRLARTGVAGDGGQGEEDQDSVERTPHSPGV